MSDWNDIDDIIFVPPPTNLNVIVRINRHSPTNNSEYMIAHYIPRLTVEYNGWDDWCDYCDLTDKFYLKEGWYANTTYIGDDYSSYYICEDVISWKYIN